MGYDRSVLVAELLIAAFKLLHKEQSLEYFDGRVQVRLQKGPLQLRYHVLIILKCMKQPSAFSRHLQS